MLPLAFLMVAGGALLVVAGATGSSLASVLAGHPDGANVKTPAPGAVPAGSPTGVTGATPAGTAPSKLPASGSFGGFIAKGQKVEGRRRDQGRDLQLAPGAPLVASGEGYVVGVKSDPSGFGPDYPVVHFTSGPDKGLDVYFGHVDSAVRVGEKFISGAILAHTSTTGHNAPPGWVEIGLAPGGAPGPFGQPLPAGL